MKTWQKIVFHSSAVMVAITGLLYLWMKYLLENSDPFSVVNHPWQPWVLYLHLAAAPVLVFIVGVIFNSHITSKLAKKRMPNRKSGFGALFSFPLMVISGYLLQIVANPLFFQWVLVLHLVSSGVFVLTYVVHQVISFRLIRKVSPKTVRESSSPDLQAGPVR